MNIPEVLETSATIAIVGCSDKMWRTSYQIAEYLKESGYRIIPVNPNLEGREVLGERSRGSLSELPENVHEDIVVIFRNNRHTAALVGEVAGRAERTGRKPVVWTQLDVSSREAEEAAGRAGLPYVKNRCILAEHSR